MNNKISLGIDKVANNKNISSHKKIFLLKKLRSKIIDMNNKKSKSELNTMLYNNEKTNNKNKENVNKNNKVYVKKSGFVNPLIFTLLISILFSLCIMIGYIISLM